MGQGSFAAVGRITRTHGLKGEVSVIVDHGASLDSLMGLEAWIVPPPASLRTTRLVSTRPGPKGPLVRLDGVETLDAARELCGREILVRTAELPEGWDEPDESDEVGFEVRDVTRGNLGTIDEVLVTGANDVWVVHGSYGEVLVPVIDDVVIEVDDQARTALVRLLPGLIADEDDEG